MRPGSPWEVGLGKGSPLMSAETRRPRGGVPRGWGFGGGFPGGGGGGPGGRGPGSPGWSGGGVFSVPGGGAPPAGWGWGAPPPALAPTATALPQTTSAVAPTAETVARRD